jgi:hypothetical protein
MNLVILFALNGTRDSLAKPWNPNPKFQ